MGRSSKLNIKMIPYDKKHVRGVFLSFKLQTAEILCFTQHILPGHKIRAKVQGLSTGRLSKLVIWLVTFANKFNDNADNDLTFPGK